MNYYKFLIKNKLNIIAMSTLVVVANNVDEYTKVGI